jgi:putative ABC transport system permease protein
VAIRIARRDARRYKWRSALIVAMVGLPVLFLTSGITLLATNEVSMAESLPGVMGSAQVRLHDSGGGRQDQAPDGKPIGFIDDGARALAVPGFAPGSAWTAGKVQKLTGGRAIQTVTGDVRVTQGDRRPRMPILGIDGRDALARGMTELVSGRWASTPAEVVVTPAGIDHGLPRAGTLTTQGPDGKPRQLRVVGVATAQTESDQGSLRPFLVVSPDLAPSALDQTQTQRAVAFLVGRAAPVTWSDVRRMNAYGLMVQSRAVFLDPPSETELGAQTAKAIGSQDRGADLVLFMAAVGLFLETTLLAGPAFAVSAARQRRSLALAACNGAEARQLRRYVLGQAVVLGVVSAVIAVAAGVLLTLAGLTWWQAGHADFATGPLDVSWPRVVGVFICAVVASVVAALLPARGIARLDLVSVLAGRGGDHAVRRGLPVAGAVVMVLSGIAIIWSVASSSGESRRLSEYLVVGGAIGLVLGCVMVIPALLALVGLLGARLVLPLRLAARDTARQRGRSTPAVAAIMAAVAALTALSVGATSDTRAEQLDYRAQSAMGHGRVWLNDQGDKSVRSIFRTYAPDLALYPVSTVTDPTVAAGKTAAVVAAKVPGCSVAATFGAFGHASGKPTDLHCQSLGPGAQGDHAQIRVISLEALGASAQVSDSERRVLESGGMLLLNEDLMQGGLVELITGRIKIVEEGKPAAMPSVTGHRRVPAAVVDRNAWRSELVDLQAGGWVLPQTVARLGWPVSPSYLDVVSPTGMIPAATETALNERFDSAYTLRVERGFQNPTQLILLILFSVAGLLVLIASLISTALSLAESQNDMATLAAVGATRHTRRAIAASQAFVVAACGALLGVLVGMVPGIAVTWPLTTSVGDVVSGQIMTRAPTIAIPWLPLVAICIGVPLLAAGLAWSAVRRHPQMTRRLA